MSYSNRLRCDGGAVRGLLFLVLVLAVIAASLGFMFAEVIPPGSMGVRLISFGPGQGFSKAALGPGLHWNIPYYSQIYRIPSTVQTFNFNAKEGDPTAASTSPLQVATTDRAIVEVDISVLSRFYSSPSAVNEQPLHGGPADLLKNQGVSPARWNEIIRLSADNRLKQTLGQLSTSQFYKPSLREEKVEEAQNSMRADLAPYGIKVEAVLVRRYTYQLERIEDAIFQKNLQEQEKKVNEEQSRLAEVSSRVARVTAEEDARITTKRVEGENEAKKILSEAELYEAQKRAEGDLLIAQSRAEVDRLRAQALGSGNGAQLFVARQLAPLLGSLKGGIISSLDPYNLEEWLNKLGLKQPVTMETGRR